VALLAVSCVIYATKCLKVKHNQLGKFMAQHRASFRLSFSISPVKRGTYSCCQPGDRYSFI